MNNYKHTPGNWSTTGNEIRNKNTSIIIATTYNHLHSNMSDEEQRANAKLIATAPQLLTQLSKVIKAVNDVSINIDHVNHSIELIKLATE